MNQSPYNEKWQQTASQKVLADDAEFCEEILQIILQDKKLKVLSVAVQKSVRNLVGRSVRVDALCLLGTGEKVNACL